MKLNEILLDITFIAGMLCIAVELAVIWGR